MEIPSLEGKVCIVTGANTGIGEVTARELAKAGAHLFLACRSEAKAQASIEAIRQVCGHDRVEFLPLDLSSLDAVRRGAELFLERELPLDILVNNAGLAGVHTLSEDGFEIAFAVNHLGHFLFSLLLMERMLEAERARLVTVSSRAHYRVDGLDFEKVRREAETTTGMTAYARSKLANVLFGAEAARKLADTNISTYSLHPGVIASDIWRRVPAPLRWVMTRFMITTEEGAETSLYCAASEACADESGLYYDSCKPKTPSEAARDEELAAELWARSLEWTGAPDIRL